MIQYNNLYYAPHNSNTSYGLGLSNNVLSIFINNHASIPLTPVNKSTKQIVHYLENVDKVPLEQLVVDLNRLGFEFLEYRPDKQIYKFSHLKKELRGAEQAKANLKSSKVIVEIHCDAVSGPHMHITDTHGNVYDKYLNNLTAKLRQENPGLAEKVIEKRVERMAEAHIKIKEFVELNIRPTND